LLLGNGLIVLEAGATCPDENVDDGIEFDFEPMVLLKNIGLLDVDYATIVKIIFQNEYRQMEAKNIVVPLLSDNSYQLLPLDVWTMIAITGLTEITQPCVHTCNGLFICQLYSLPDLLEETYCKEDTPLTLPFASFVSFSQLIIVI
jgi:hypothetical protein